MLWNDAMDAVLRQGWRDGHTTPQIATMIFRKGGVSVSEGAVRGRRSQLGLPPRGHLELSIAGKHKPNARPGPPRRAIIRQEMAPESVGLPWSERTFDQCAYPLTEGGGDMLACGLPIGGGARRPYCPFHLALTRQSPRAR